MLKRCWNLSRVAVGVSGLVLVLAFTLTTANAASLRRSGTQAQSGVMFGVPAGADPASSPAVLIPPAVQEFSLAGSTNINFNAPKSDCENAGLFCNTGETCQCVEANGNVSEGIGSLYHGAASFILNIVLTKSYPNGNNVGKVCFFSSGILGITPAPGSTINFITSGAACNGTSGGVALYSGGFEIGPSTGGFSAAVGAGMIGFGANFNTGIGIFDIKGAGTNLN